MSMPVYISNVGSYDKPNSAIVKTASKIVGSVCVSRAAVLRSEWQDSYDARSMNWLSNYVLPKIRAFAKKDVPDNLWQQCPGCEQMLFHRELAANLEVCRHCGHHFRIGSAARFAMLFDGGAYRKIALPGVALDPLRFRDSKRYTDRLREAQAASGPGGEAVALAEGEIGGLTAVVAAFDFAFMGGSMGVAVGEALIAASERAVERQAALIVVPASGGARMQEGILSLMQLPRTVLAADMVKEAGLPYIAILTDPTTGGVSASFAMLGDVTLAEPGAIIGFAGARVIAETIREKLPEGFQRAEYLLDHGMVDQVVPRGELKATLARILSLLREKQRDAVPALPGGAG
jgi:acetyl-CoA carboxylase carboxyl transferase subunit beta